MQTGNFITLIFATSVIYGQEVLYAARGQDARSRPAKAGIQWFNQEIPASAVIPVFEALINLREIHSQLP